MSDTTALAKAPSPELATWAAMREQANELVKSGFLPKAVNTPEKAMAIIQTGKELGLGPMQSLRSIHIIEGKPTMSADLIAGLALQRVPGSVLRVVESTDAKCVVEAARPGHEPTKFTWTMGDAQKAGLTNKDNWRKYPRAMLRARVITEAARAMMPDAVVGLYDPDELGAVTTPTGEVVELPRVIEVAPHITPGVDPAASEDADVATFLLGALQDAKATIAAGVDSYDKALALRAIIGTKAKQSDLTKRIQEASESGAINGNTHRELGKLWQHCHRQIEKLEKELAPGPEEAMRDPGADEDEDQTL